jgi:CRP-like cAMP-binding protein
MQIVIQKIPVTNLLIEAFPTRQRNKILKLCTLVELDFGTVLCEANQPYQYVYFPLTSFFTSIAVVAENPPLEVALIGNEGMLGIGVALGIDTAIIQSVVMGSGTALRIPVLQFQRELLTSPALVILLNRYIYILMQQLAQSTVCIHFHEIEARLARWLLMTNDRAHEDTFFLTHVNLARMLGVRRSGVSIAASELRKKSVLSYARGKIRILNRKGLEAASCSCYRAMQGHYSELLPRINLK